MSKPGDRSSVAQTYKIVVVGGGGVGKSAITIQFIQVLNFKKIQNKATKIILNYQPSVEHFYCKSSFVKWANCCS